MNKDMKTEVKEEKSDLDDSFSLKESSFLNESSDSGVHNMDELLLFDDCVEVPTNLFTDTNLFHQFFSLDTWENCFSDTIKQKVLGLMPSFNDPDEIQRTIAALFQGENIAFGNPLVDFREQVLRGNFSPDRRKLCQYVRSAKNRESKLEMEDYQFRLMREVLKSRKQLLEKTSGSTVSIPLAVQKMDNKTLNLSSRMRIRSRSLYLRDIRRIKSEVGEEGWSSDDEQIFKACQEGEKVISLIPDIDSADQNSGLKEENSQSAAASAANLDEEKMRGSLTQESQPSYFHLIRDLFQLGTDFRLTTAELDQAMSVWQESPIAALNSWYSLCADPRGWRSSISSAVSFLSGSCPDQTPPSFQPFLAVEDSVGCYKWVGEERMEAFLGNLFDWWWERRDLCKPEPVNTPNTKSGLSWADADSELAVSAQEVPATTWRVRPSSLQERLEYQRQECLRYASPTKPFRWVMQDYSVCVGPVKGVLTVKVKNHAMLKPNRPPYVTILTLVRDAVSRLPNGEGSRTDIMELLTDSQYLVPNMDTASLNTTVSGALDRLQNEADSCVKYDSNRKIWIYLHRDKTMEELENMHRNSRPRGGRGGSRGGRASAETGGGASSRATSTRGKPRAKKKQKVTGQDPSTSGIGSGQQHVVNSALIGVLPGSPTQSQAFATSTPKRKSGGSSSSSSQQLPTTSSPSAQQHVQQQPQNVQRIIVRGADGEMVPLSPGTLQHLIQTGAVDPRATLLNQSN